MEENTIDVLSRIQISTNELRADMIQVNFLDLQITL